MLGIDGFLKICDLKWSLFFFCLYIFNFSDVFNFRILELIFIVFMLLIDIILVLFFWWKSLLFVFNFGESINEMRIS